MSKATTAIVSLLVVACVGAFAHWIPALLAANSILSALFLALIVVLSIAGAGLRRSLRRDRSRNTQAQRRHLNRSHLNRSHLNHGLALACLLALPVPIFAAPQTTAHFAGWWVTVGTGLNNPQGVAVDASGNVYIADTGNNRVLIETRVGNTYTQTTVVGSGISSPSAVAVDESGNVYIADTGNNRVLIETLSEGTYTQTTVGTGLSGPQGVAVDESGNVYISDTGNDRVLIETLSDGTYTQTMVVCEVASPNGVAVDASGDVYIADGNDEVLLETLAGETYTPTTVASGLSTPQGVAVDAIGDVYIANCCSNQVLIETPSDDDYNQTTVGIGLNQPFGVAVDAGGNVYIADTANNRVLMVQKSANFGSLALGTISPVISMGFTFDSEGSIGAPAVLTQGAAGLDFADAGTGTCSTNGTEHVYAVGDSCTIDMTYTPQFPGVRFGAAVLQSNTGNTIASGQGYGIGLGSQANFVPGTLSTVTSGFTFPFGIAVDAKGNVFVADESANTLYKLTLSGGVYTTSTISTDLVVPGGVALDGAGNVYVAEVEGGDIRKETLSNGAYSETTIVSGLNNLDGIALDSAGNLYIASYNDDIVYKETLLANGSYVQTEIGSALSGPTGVAVDLSGNVYITNYTGGNVYKETLQADGSYIQSTVASEFSSPATVVVDASGNLYIGNTGTAVYKETPQTEGAYIQSTVASGLTSLFWMAADEMGNIFINQSSGIVSKLTLAVPPALAFLPAAVGSTSSDSPQIVTVSNIGTAALSFPVPASGSNPSITLNFTLSSAGDTACPLVASGASSPGSLAAGASCLLPISFSPTGAGSPIGSLVMTDSSLDATGPAYATQTISLSGTVAPSATTTTLTASPNPLGDGQLLTLTATVAPAPSGTPDGTVSFYSGTKLLGTATLTTSGIATLTLTSLVVGTDSLTAVYSGCAGFLPSTSATVSLKVTSSYTISAPATPFDVAEGGFVVVNITVPPLGGAFNSTVTLSASGLPAGATATFNPPTVVPGTTGAPTALTIQLASLSAGIPARQFPAHRGFPAASLSLAFVLFGAVLARKRIPRALVLVLGLASLGITTSLLTSCNGGFANVPQTRAGTYVVTVTGTSGTINSSATITLVVE
ncbi:MAG: Ig-like domain repeat protein [Candidatus Sulfotelmatobacter sp.]